MKLCRVEENIALIMGMHSWTQKGRCFRGNAKEAKQHGLRKFGVMR